MEKTRAPKIIVFATSFLDPLPTLPQREGEAKALLEEAATARGIDIEYRCSRDPRTALEAQELEGAVAVIADLERYDRELLARVGQGSREDSPGSTWGGLALISRYGVGCDGVDLEAAQEHGVLVSNTPGANSRPTAEWTLSTILDVAGGRVLQHERASQGLSKAGPSRIDIEGKIAGIVGTGAVGRRVASLLSSMGAEVVAADLIPDRTWADSMGVRYVDLEQLCRTAQIISLHASGSERLIGERELDTMKTGTILINCARFHLVDNRAAYQAVAKGHLRGYGLDESWPYPDLSLSGLNIVTSPHVGSDSDIGKAHMQLMSVQAVADFLEGRPPAQLLTSQ